MRVRVYMCMRVFVYVSMRACVYVCICVRMPEAFEQWSSRRPPSEAKRPGCSRADSPGCERVLEGFAHTRGILDGSSISSLRHTGESAFTDAKPVARIAGAESIHLQIAGLQTLGPKHKCAH